MNATSKLFPDRNIMHKQMGAAEDFPCCDGRGILLIPEEGTEEDYIPDVRERYCACEAGQKRKKLET